MDIQKVGNAITFLRKRAGYTQKDLATRIGISDKAVSKWERGISLPDTALLGKLSILLDTDTDSLLSGDVIHHDRRWSGILKIDENPCGIHAGTLIFDKPLVYFLLGYFMLVGIRDIRIECDRLSREFILQEIGTGDRFGIHLSFGETYSRKASNYMVVLGRSIIYGVDQTRFFQRAMIHPDRFTVLSLPKGMRDGNQGLTFNAEKRLVEDGHEDQVNTQYNYYNLPIFFCRAEQLTLIGGIENLSSNAFVQIDNIYTEVLDRGYIELPVNTWEDVSEASSLIRTVQKACGMEVYCLEEIAWRRGMITTEQLKEYGNKQRDNPHGKYIMSLIG